MMVMVVVVMIYIKEEQNLCWFRIPICILTMKSQYVIAGPLFVLPIYSTDYF